MLVFCLYLLLNFSASDSMETYFTCSVSAKKEPKMYLTENKKHKDMPY